jgi:phosphoribosyl 1,2-cyclic phosphodiesterase
MEDALEFASLTGVKRLLLSHHDPMHSDARLDEMFATLRERTSVNFTFEMAVEGSRIEM